MKETLLLLGFSKERQSKLVRALLPLKMRIRRVEPDQYEEPLGALVGLEPTEGEKTQPGQDNETMPMGDEEQSTTKQTQPMEDEMLVMAGLSDRRVDAVLGALRKGKVGPIPYKAVLTAANQSWNGYELLAELKKEHARFTGETPESLS